VEAKLTPEDQDAILEIARTGGITRPSTVTEPVRSRCPLVSVESSPVVHGNRVLSEVLHVRQFSGPDCNPALTERPHHRNGNWLAFLGDFNPQRRERWRIRDGNWHVDVLFGPDMPYEDAVSIVRAIRHRHLVDRRSLTNEASPVIRYIHPNRIGMIRKSSKSSVPRTYEVTTGDSGGGDWLVLQIQNGMVELHNHELWIS
jgi:hypothetical protein